MSFIKDLDDVIESIKLAKKDKSINVNLLIGAGCSVTAGIPAAQGIIEEIQDQYPRYYSSANNKDYANCMSQLTPYERKNLIIEKVSNAKVNWAHIAIAQLLKEGFVNRVLTTNFDNLILRACSLVGEYPAIYDLATSNKFRSDLLFEKSVLHLHGQHTGFILCNTEDEVNDQAENLKGVFNELKKQSLWIIVGYSGENDAIFKLLSEEEAFEHRLFWVGFKDNAPSDTLKNNLLDSKRYSFYINGYDADDFFVSLANRLDIFPPEFITKPFTYLNSNMEVLSPYTMPKSEVFYKVNELNSSTKNVITEAIQTIENDNVLMANHLITVGLHDQLLPLLEKSSKEERDEIIKKFKLVKEDTINELLEEVKKYKEAYEENSKDSDALHSWADTLRYLVQMTEGEDEKKYLNMAIEKYELICIDNTKEPQNFFRLGNLYLSYVNKYEDEIDPNICKEKLLKAIDNLEIASQLGGNEDIYSTLGIALGSLAIILEEKKPALESLQRSCDFLEKAHYLNKADATHLVNWGITLAHFSSHVEEKELKIDYLKEAIEKLKSALKLDPNDKKIILSINKKLIDLANCYEDNDVKLSIYKEALDVISELINLDNLDKVDTKVSKMYVLNLIEIMSIDKDAEIISVSDALDFSIKLVNLSPSATNIKLLNDLYKVILENEQDVGVRRLYLKESIETLNSIENKDNDVLFKLIGIQYHQLGRITEGKHDYFEKAFQNISKACEIDSTNIVYLMNSAIIQKDQALYLNNKSKIEESVNIIKRAIELAPNDYHLIISSAELLVEIAIKEKEREKREYYYLLACKTLNGLPKEESWIERILNTWPIVLDGMALSYSKDNVDLNKYFTTFLMMFSKFQAEIEENKITFDMARLNGIAYSLIKSNEYHLSEQFLQLCLERENNTDILSNFLPLATKGLWYFLNPDMGVQEAETYGKKFYEKAISISVNLDDKDKKYHVALQQIYHFELFKFLHSRKKDKEGASRNLIIAFNFGIVQEYEDVHRDIVKAMEKLKVSPIISDEVAAGKDEDEDEDEDEDNVNKS
ncbi:hypothetical protein [Alkalihalophilus marmarensis]|uniref:hypothetical protein n=1 Tax=Alkalihalophilus marmarensis TaxID=521377 RepID=UPI002DBF1B88|nr:hypothetical protein [Alkalihalophilus marmarensis]MEC2073749.1 hypothetical protein [Alkalihalophilus marmarensis]